jgi:predicted porin
MKKKAIALAVGAMCVAPAAHSQIMFGNDTIGTVQFYGKLYPQYMWSTSKGATQGGSSVSTLVATSGTTAAGAVADSGSRIAVDSQNTYLGFRGERNLGSTGLKGIWQVEQSIGIDGVGTNGFSNRNSFLGLSHRHGTIKLGNMDTIYKDYGDVMQMFGVSSGNFTSASNVLSQIGVGSNTVARFHERAPNSVQIETGEYAGVKAGFQYSPDEQRGNSDRSINANLYSFGVKWNSGPVYLSAQHEIHNDFFGATINLGAASLRNGTIDNTPGLTTDKQFTATPGAHSKDTASRITGEYRIGTHRIVGDVAWLKYKESNPTAGTHFQSYKKTNWDIGWDARWTDTWRTGIQYVQAGAGTCTLTAGDCSTSGLRGRMLNGGVTYAFDRQTFLYVIAGKLWNDASAQYDNWQPGNPKRGADITQAAVGMSYTF